MPEEIDIQSDKPRVSDKTHEVEKLSNRACSSRILTTTCHSLQETQVQLPIPVRVTERSDNIPTRDW
ncbi:hypothetical protein DPMN_096243 [Dreissena polymorpha]|uniref:Uncharacterized protein n=1 Tax=Dreissena polymorpha TaxID=45954 RepID=A0A9D4R3H2_DREPO|nr:hypothetical protein DPMN_096243 [Dreissena polymorpha]